MLGIEPEVTALQGSCQVEVKVGGLSSADITIHNFAYYLG